MPQGSRPTPPGAGSAPEFKQHLQDLSREETRSASRRRPPPEVRTTPWLTKVLVALAVVLGALVIRNVQLALDPVEIEAADEATMLAEELRIAIDDVVDFQVEEGRLPDAAEAAEFLPEDVTFVRVAGGFELSRTIPLVGVIRYSSEDDPETWLAAVEGSLAEGGS